MTGTKLYGSKEVAALYNVSQCTARRYMREMHHMEKPLRVFASDLKAWENRRTVESREIVMERLAKEKALRKQAQAADRAKTAARKRVEA
ncbi:MAG: hypothetical protein IJ188_03100 [Clostridia bacterium]|nr:hypothetical protein [Clostridia bacterium]